MAPPSLRIGTAAWAIPRDVAGRFPADDGSQLQRYSQVMNCTEINSSFYRSHRPETYERWASETPPGFRFAVKLPRTITHEQQLRRAREPLRRLLDEAGGLGDKLGLLLAQLPPSLAFEARAAAGFFDTLLRQQCGFAGAIAVEPRHPSWFTAAAERLLQQARISRVGADPVPRAVDADTAARPGGWLGAGAIHYLRWHGSPRMYWSDYPPDWLRCRLDEIGRLPTADRAGPAEAWCIFDNTASGRALPNALALRAMVLGPDSGDEQR